MMKILVLFALLLSISGCYQLAPAEDDMRTVPVTNNPNLLPGPVKTNPLPMVPN